MVAKAMHAAVAAARIDCYRSKMRVDAVIAMNRWRVCVVVAVVAVAMVERAA